VGASVTVGWENFFVAEAGASAALSGLVFVAVAINLSRILSFPHLPGRAAQTLVVLVLVLLISTFGLVPGQSLRALGAECLFVGCLGIFSVSWIQYRDRKHAQKRIWVLVQIMTSQLPVLPFVISGSLLLLCHPSGIYWLVAGTVLSFVAGVVNAWVLLVEILR
jgi:hypothetical protein